jgi:hypothetical protein
MDGGGGGEPLTVSRHVIAARMKEGTGRVPNFASRIAMRGYISWEDFFFTIVKRWFLCRLVCSCRHASDCPSGVKGYRITACLYV